MKTLIETIAKALVDYPEQVEVTQVEEEQKITYVMSVHPEDVGKVIGKQGRVASAIRTVVQSAASQQNKKVYVEIKD